MTSSDSPGAANTLLIERFYAAFGAGDGEAMAACYAPGAHFADPVFPDLHGSEPGEMWRMLTATPGDLKIELLEHEDGLIADHHDDFDFYRWSRQALGPVGLLLGWTPIVRSKVN